MSESGQVGPCSPFFIVADLPRSLAHYVGQLGFECRYSSPEPDPFFAIVGRGAAQILLKVIGDQVTALPNHERHVWAPWDAFIFAGDPDALAGEFAGRKVPFHRALDDSDDQLRGFEIIDPDGYVCFFGRPI